MRPSDRSIFVPLAVLITSLAAGAADAAVTKAFRQTSAKDFEEGEATGSMVLPTGEVVPGMKATSQGLEAAFAWCAAKSPDGRTAYFGTGDEGRVWALDLAAKDARARKLASLDAAWVTALAVRPDGTVLAATTPGGRIHSVDPKTGRSKVLAALNADHVWALALDKNGTVYAGTGGPGKIFAVDTGGKVRPIWDSGDKHVVSLIPGDGKHLFAGTSEEAILYRVGLDGRAEAIADFDAEEVRALALSSDRRSLFAAVNDFEKTGGPTLTGPATAAPKGTKVTTASSGSPTSAGALPRPGARKAKAALYRIDHDGRMEQMFSIADGYFTSVALDDDGRAYVGTGSEGRVFRVAPDRTAALAIDVPERQALALLRAGKTFLIATGDVGGVYGAEPAAAKQAGYLSRVLDAEYRAHWGLLRWTGSRPLAVETRSGNTAKPDATWSGFAALARPRPTTEGGVGQVISPPARYVQYKVTFEASGARLSGVTLAYLAQNQRARITEIGVADGGGAQGFGSPAPAAGLGSLAAAATLPPPPRVHNPMLKLRWKVENPDGDELTYRLSFREDSDAVWRPLGGPDPLTKTELDWNTEALPDGTYVVRVVASDERSEPRERALEASLISEPILVDNRKPQVLGLTARYPFVSGRARDDQSPLTALEYAIDGGEWHVLPAADGICDDVVEHFNFKLPALAPGPHAITVRAWDSADNVGAAGVTVRPK
jgi:sugar lactone lactonase YvrE